METCDDDYRERSLRKITDSEMDNLTTWQALCPNMEDLKKAKINHFEPLGMKASFVDV